MPLDISRVPSGGVSSGRESASVTKSSEVSNVAVSGATAGGVNSDGSLTLTHNTKFK